tara:strand:+ start:2722 stop:4374 length:1653 start_codon:yes stop_codon:yes gene_type:complete
MVNRIDTPSISSDLSDEDSQRLFNESVKECVEVLEGKRGDGLDRALTARDLAQAGILTVNPAILYSGGSSSGITFGKVSGVVEFPTTPTNLVISGAFTNLLLVWDKPTFQGYAHTEIWRYDANEITSSVKIATSAHHMYSDPVEPNSSFFYWVRFVNTNDQKGSFNQTSGTAGVTNKKVSTLISELNDHIPADVLILDDGTVAGAAPFLTVYGDGLTVGAEGGEFYYNTTQLWQQQNHPLGRWFKAGSYLNSAFIADASIDMAKIHNLEVDFANVTGELSASLINSIQINADQITAGVLNGFTINASYINGGSISGTDITGVTIVGAIIAASAYTAPTEAALYGLGANHYALTQGVQDSASSSGGGGGALNAVLDIRALNYYQTALQAATDNTSNNWRYRRRYVTPTFSGTVSITRESTGFYDANRNQLCANVRIRLFSSVAKTTTIAQAIFEIKVISHGGGDKSLSVSNGGFTFSLKYPLRAWSEGDWTVWYYNAVTTGTITYSVTGSGSFTDAQSLGLCATVDYYGLDKNLGLGNKTITISDAADNDY